MRRSNNFTTYTHSRERKQRERTANRQHIFGKRWRRQSKRDDAFMKACAFNEKTAGLLLEFLCFTRHVPLVCTQMVIWSWYGIPEIQRICRLVLEWLHVGSRWRLKEVGELFWSIAIDFVVLLFWLQDSSISRGLTKRNSRRFFCSCWAFVVATQKPPFFSFGYFFSHVFIYCNF